MTHPCPICAIDTQRHPCCEKCQAAYDLTPASLKRFVEWALARAEDGERLDWREAKFTYSMYLDDEGDFVVGVHGMPGCRSHGATPTEAMWRLLEVQKLWIEDVNRFGPKYPHVQTCTDCGKPERIAWLVDDEFYIKVMGQKHGATPCLYCLDSRARQMGLFPVYRVSVQNIDAARAGGER